MSAATAALSGKTSVKPSPVTRDEFIAKAGAMPCELNGIPIILEVKEFQTGSFGWNYSGKINVKIGGVLVPVQVGINATVCGSKLV